MFKSGLKTRSLLFFKFKIKAMLKEFVTVIFNPTVKIFSIFRFKEESSETNLLSNLQEGYKAKRVLDSNHELSTKNKLLSDGYREIPSHP